MKFRRKSEPQAAPVEETPEPTADATGPWDSSAVDDEVERVDLGSLRIPSLPNREVRLQVDEQTQTVQAVLIVGQDGALEIRAFAAPRNGSLWDEARPHIAAETSQAGGTVEEREGRFGTELLCVRTVQTPEGQTGQQQSRIVGADGDRWMLRGTFVGRPAVEESAMAEWDETLTAIVVHRGSEAMPAGEALPVHLPAAARRVD